MAGRRGLGEGAKEIMRVILSTHKKEMDTRELRARTDVDLYIEPTSVHVLCSRLKDGGFIKLVRKERAPGESGRARHVYSVTPKGAEVVS